MLYHKSLSGSIIALFCTFFLPPVNASIYFYPDSPLSEAKKNNYKTIDFSLKTSKVI